MRKEKDMLPVILIAAAAALITACESSSSSQRSARKSRFKPKFEKYTGLNLDSSSYQEESKAEKLMKKMRPGGKMPTNGAPKKPRPIGGDPAALPPPIEEWKKKCTDDGHSVESKVLDGHSWSSLACVSESGKICAISNYYKGSCSLD